jgi:hypothetical protein
LVALATTLVVAVARLGTVGLGELAVTVVEVLLSTLEGTLQTELVLMDLQIPVAAQELET